MFLFGDLKNSCWDAVLPDELLACLRGELPRLPEGKTVLVPEKLWINRFTVEPKPPAGREWEAHREFADLQLVLDGNELCLLDNQENCVAIKEYERNGDCGMFTHSGKDFHTVFLTPGTALLIPPPLVHLPDTASASFAGVLPKIVAKIHRSLLPRN